MPTHLWPVSIASLDPDIYTNEALVAQARDLLMQRNGLPVSKVLAEIAVSDPLGFSKIVELAKGQQT